MIRSYYVYILASKGNGTLYIGVTNDLSRRVWEHKDGKIKGFTKKYHVTMLMYYEEYANVEDKFIVKKCLRTGADYGNFGLLKRRTLSGEICMRILSEDWIPACAGMTRKRKRKNVC